MQQNQNILELADKRVGKQQDQRDNQRVDTGGLGHCDTEDHGTGDIALCFGLTADRR